MANGIKIRTEIGHHVVMAICYYHIILRYCKTLFFTLS